MKTPVFLSLRFKAFKNGDPAFFCRLLQILLAAQGPGNALDAPQPAAQGSAQPFSVGEFIGNKIRPNEEIQQVAGLKNKLLGGEGFFNTVISGPGKVWIQTMPMNKVAGAIRPYIPTGN